MGFCPNCGKEIADGMVCDCQSVNVSEEVITSKNQKKGFAIIGVALVIIIVAVIMMFSSITGGYKKPVNQLINGLNSCDFEKVFSATIPDDKLKEVKDQLKEYDMDWDELIEEMNDSFEEYIEELEEDYGKNVKFSVKFVDKEKVDDDEFEELEDAFEDDFDVEIKKAYKVKVKVTIKGKDDKDSSTSWLYVAKVKGDDWKVSTYDDESGLSDILGSSLF